VGAFSTRGRAAQAVRAAVIVGAQIADVSPRRATDPIAPLVGAARRIAYRTLGALAQSVHGLDRVSVVDRAIQSGGANFGQALLAETSGVTRIDALRHRDRVPLEHVVHVFDVQIETHEARSTAVAQRCSHARFPELGVAVECLASLELARSVAVFRGTCPEVSQMEIDAGCRVLETGRHGFVVAFLKGCATLRDRDPVRPALARGRDLVELVAGGRWKLRGRNRAPGVDQATVGTREFDRGGEDRHPPMHRGRHGRMPIAQRR
jgi:hypothetical protein